MRVSTQKNAYNAEVIKQLGFDPTVRPGQTSINDSAVRKKVSPSPSALDGSSGGGSTYVMSGHIVSNSSKFVAENIGRERVRQKLDANRDEMLTEGIESVATERRSRGDEGCC